mmetsp:Transcript_74412/g.206622  ORF Transcript_74412/g.206622 Transcript_74412/m.206622 type:complete len:259 (+) Transcript_74412:1064-1840(+)
MGCCVLGVLKMFSKFRVRDPLQFETGRQTGARSVPILQTIGQGRNRANETGFCLHVSSQLRSQLGDFVLAHIVRADAQKPRLPLRLQRSPKMRRLIPILIDKSPPLIIKDGAVHCDGGEPSRNLVPLFSHDPPPRPNVDKQVAPVTMLDKVPLLILVNWPMVDRKEAISVCSTTLRQDPHAIGGVHDREAIISLRDQAPLMLDRYGPLAGRKEAALARQNLTATCPIDDRVSAVEHALPRGRCRSDGDRDQDHDRSNA